MHRTSEITRGLAVVTVLLAAASLRAADYPATVLGDNPRGYYRFNDTTKRENVNVNIGSIGLAANATNLNVHPVAGAIAGSPNSAAYFDSSARSIVPWNAGVNPDASKDFTIEAWFYPTSDKVAGSFVGPAPIMNRYSGPVANRQGWVYFQRNPDDTYSGDGQSDVGWNFRTYTGVGSHVGVSITSGVPYKLGQWQHVVTVWDAATQTATMYIDGQQAATGGNTSADPKAYEANTNDHGDEQGNGAAGLAIGSYNNTEAGSNPFRGAVDEVALYAKKLTAAQILAHYQNATNAARATPYETLVQQDAPALYLRFNEASPDTDVAVNMGSTQNAGAGANSDQVRHKADGVLTDKDGAYAYHWRNGSSTTDIPWLAANNPGPEVPFTFETWLKATSDRINPGACPVNNRYAKAGNRTGWVIFQRAPNDTYSTQSGYEGVGWNFRVYTGTGGGGQDVTTSTPYTVGEWQHFVVTWEPQTDVSPAGNGATAWQGILTAYINGVQVAQNAAATYAANTETTEDGSDPVDLAIGAYNKSSTLGNNPYEGLVDELAIYNNYVLTTNQIAAHYEAGTNAHPATNYATLVLSAAYDGASTQALQPATYLRFNEPAYASATNSGSAGPFANASLIAIGDRAAGPQAPANAGFETNNAAIQLSSQPGLISLGNPGALQISGAITLEAWIKPDATQGDVARIISHGPVTFSNYPDGAVETNGGVFTGPEVFLRMEGAGATYVAGSFDGTNAHTVSFAVPAEDLGGANWVHLVATCDTAHWTLYRNGVQVATVADTTGAVAVNDADWAIGATGNGWGDTFAGVIDEAAIYASALSAARVAAHYQAGTTGGGAGGELKLSISQTGGAISITWPTGVLQQSDTVNGTYTDVAGAASPFTPANPTGAKFYRLRQ
ncbi:MAG TPA: LamG domain-containing protein [Verrucomicrobiae bacterium]|nr:LamG domain-containing protein [Verrucomicrobiae bacterium]